MANSDSKNNDKDLNSDLIELLVRYLEQSEMDSPIDYATLSHSEEYLRQLAAEATLDTISSISADAQAEGLSDQEHLMAYWPTLCRLVLDNLVMTAKLSKLENNSEALKDTHMLFNKIALQLKKKGE